jgi:hypothetical protein
LDQLAVCERIHALRQFHRSIVASCGAFAAAGFVSRLVFFRVETRLHILAFCLFSLVIHFGAKVTSDRGQNEPTRPTFIWNAAAATLAIVATKIALEGVPYRILSLFSV